MARARVKASSGRPDATSGAPRKKRPAAAKPRPTRRRTARSDIGGDPVIVGIGASAGGLEALRALISGLPEHADISYVIAQHLDPKHSSALVDLLSRNTKMRVSEIKDGQAVQADEIYITPPDRNAVIEEGVLRLSRPTTAFGPKPSVDMLFSSLAEDKKERAVGIVLSGTGSDGAHGIRSIRGAGGITIAQDLETAKYDGMPGAAIATQCIDLVLPPDKMGAELVRVRKQAPALPAAPKEEVHEGLERILQLLLERTGSDFSDYKLGTISRRIQRRMVTMKVTELPQYIEILEKSPDEVKRLHRDILISVTEFFRDPEVFKGLRQALATITAGKKPGDDIRVWVPGCASGEEAFTIAMLLSDTLGERARGLNIQIFATDVDEEALDRGRSGIYPPAAVANLPDALVKNYFVHSDGGFAVSKRIREFVIFAKHDLAKDPPFAHLDFISCRNVLIYFNTKLQDRVLSMFHFALNSDGYLLLGKSEGVNRYTDLFAPITRSAKIYRRIGSADTAFREFLAHQPPLARTRDVGRDKAKEAVSLERIMDAAILHMFSGAGVLVNPRQEILYVRGNVRPYLGLSEGNVGYNIFNMAEMPLRHELRAVILKSGREHQSITSRPILMGTGDQARHVTIRAEPVAGAVENGLIAVCFDEIISPAQNLGTVQDDGVTDVRLAELERELYETRENLQTTVEELETANEELQSLNEELVSTNEELQSSNEQLQTTNEEMQSTNEELVTVNEELQVKSAQLGNANSDLENIQASIDLPLLVLDRHLNIKRFSKEASQIFMLQPNDAGKAITAVPAHIDLHVLQENVKAVIATGTPATRTFEDAKSSFWAHMFPYVQDGAVEGAVVTFIDMTEQRAIENELRKLSSAVEHSPSSILITDDRGTIEYVNPTFSAVSGYGSDEAVGQNPRILKSGVHPTSVYEDLWKTITSGRVWRGELCNKAKNGSLYWELVAIAPVKNAEGRITHHIGIQHDMTENREMAVQLHDLQEHLLRISRLSELGQMASALAHEINQPLAAALNYVNACRRLTESIDDPAVDKVFDMASKAATQVERAGTIIHGLRSISEKRQSEGTIADISRVVEEACSLAFVGTTGQGIQTSLTLASGLPRVRIDVVQVQQVVLNLVRNSIEAMADSPNRRLQVVTARCGDNAVEVVVHDTGPGLPESVAARLFEPFVTTKPEGVGIGLSISRSIVESHGGRLWVSTADGGGVTFHFTLPNAAAEAEEGRSVG